MLPRPSRHFSIAVLLMLALAFGVGAAKTVTQPPPAERIYDMQWLDINKWLCPFYNDGRFGLDITIGTGEAGGSWPQPYKNKYIFGAGLWFGTLKPRVDDPEKVDTLVTFGYNPNSGGTEMTPTDAAHASGGAGDPNDRIYKFPGTWPPPKGRYTAKGWRFGANRRDTIDAELVPSENFSLQDMWCVYCDLGEDNHVSPGQPQGIEVYQTVYAWNYPSNEDIFFIIYKMRNATDVLLGGEGVTLKRCFAGALMDPDIGAHADDMVGLLLDDSVAMPTGDTVVVKNVGFAGDIDNHEEPTSRLQWEEGVPGVVAYKFLESPLKDSVLPSGEDTLVQLGMTSFKKFTIDIDPVTDPTQYLTMAGFDYRTGVLSNYDSIDDAAADKRFVQCSGPFDLAPGQVEILTVACIAAPFGPEDAQWEGRRSFRYNDSLWQLAAVANNAQFIYDQGWLLPGPPPSPNITLVPGDNSIRIVWDNKPERAYDPYYRRVASKPGPGYDPKYLEYDFQGYIVYKSSDGSTWDLMTQCDIGDEIPAESTLTYPPGGDSTLPDSMWIEMANTGLFYNVLDEDVINGFNYYYSVTAYDWNYITTEWDSLHKNPVAWDTLILRSGIVSNYFSMPRWDPVNYIDPIIEVVTMKGDSLAPALKWYPQVVVPFDVTDDDYQATFLGPQFISQGRCRIGYLLENKTNPDTVVDTIMFDYTIGDTYAFSAGVFNGTELACTLNVERPDRAHDSVWIESTSGNYPEENLLVSRALTSQAAWAFRGSDYKIVWTDEPGYMTAKVYDLSKGEMELGYKPFITSGSGPENANGWCFASTAFRHPTDSLWDSTAQFYICGGYIAFNADSLGRGQKIGLDVNEIKPGDVWMVKGNKEGGTAPYYNVYEVQCTPGREDLTTKREFVVKVVPNPYIVFDAWESNSEERVVKFTHLPSRATIRIFTLSGDLVKVIEHHHASEDQEFEYGGTANWDFLNDNNQLIAAGVYVYNVESDVGEYTGKLVFIH